VHRHEGKGLCALTEFRQEGVEVLTLLTFYFASLVLGLEVVYVHRGITSRRLDNRLRKLQIYEEKKALDIRHEQLDWWRDFILGWDKRKKSAKS
jgi:hypothetical protein